jgi:hypothetical protein
MYIGFCIAGFLFIFFCEGGKPYVGVWGLEFVGVLLGVRSWVLVFRCCFEVFGIWHTELGSSLF